MRWSTVLLKRRLLHNPIVASLWYNIRVIPHLIRVTPLKVPSKKYGPMIQVTVTLALSSWVVGGLTC